MKTIRHYTEEIENLKSIIAEEGDSTSDLHLTSKKSYNLIQLAKTITPISSIFQKYDGLLATISEQSYPYRISGFEALVKYVRTYSQAQTTRSTSLDQLLTNTVVFRYHC